jgi:hypothetical protein
VQGPGFNSCHQKATTKLYNTVFQLEQTVALTAESFRWYRCFWNNIHSREMARIDCLIKKYCDDYYESEEIGRGPEKMGWGWGEVGEGRC